jgi:hypothetical protein
MPAAGKSRKGVFKMKKLLLVMLVPVMVLGMMGCGGGLETGTEIPEWLQGRWTNSGTDSGAIVVTANEISVFDSATLANVTAILAFRVEYKGPTDRAKVAAAAGTGEDAKFSLTFTRIYDGVNYGTLNATLTTLVPATGEHTFTVAIDSTTDPGWKAGDMPYYELISALFGTDFSAPILFTKAN